jgi:hypothetical protein
VPSGATKEDQIVAVYDHVITLVKRLGTDTDESLGDDLTFWSLDLDRITFDEVARV